MTGSAPEIQVPGAQGDGARGADSRGMFGRWSLRSRLTLLFVLAGVAVVLVASLCVASVVHLVDTRHTLLGQIDPASLSSDQLFQAYLNQETGVRGYLLTRDTAFLQPYTDGTAQQRAASARLQASLAGHPDLLRLVGDAEAAAHAWSVEFALPAAIATRNGNTQYAESQLLGPGKARFDVIRARFASLDAALAAQRAASGHTMSTATTQLVAALGAGLVLILLAGLLLARALRVWVTAPLSRLGDAAQRVAGGELDRVIEPDGPPEITALGTDVEAMRRRIVNELTEVAAARSDLAERNTDLRRSNEELEQFAYVASHDLQEPLRKVTSFVQLLQQRYEGELDERADQYIGFAVDGSKRMQALISDLLAFSRVGRDTEDFVAVDMGVALDDAIDSLGGAVREAGATVTVVGAMPTVLGDPILLTSLWQNLIGNAVKFRGDDPPVVTVTAEPDGDRWDFSVSDNGIGIEPRFADRVFVVFQRLHHRDAYSGTGIGLAMCKKIVEFHGGTIAVDTGYTGGARLCFTLPTDGRGGAAWKVPGEARPSNS